jgi:uncharacterized membrane protein YczE
MKSKKVCYSELAYILGILTLALGTALMERADFGMSMVVAPAYLVHLKLSEYSQAFTFGVAEYLLQAVLLIVLSVVMGRFKKNYLFSFVTALLYGFVLDVMIWIVAYIPWNGTIGRCVFYLAGMLFCATGVAFFFHTYIAPEAYELFVKEISSKYNLRIDKTKTVYDCISCLAGIILSFAFFGFGHFEGVKPGTIVCALVNGRLIGLIGRILESVFVFEDAFKKSAVHSSTAQESCTQKALEGRK